MKLKLEISVIPETDIQGIRELVEVSLESLLHHDTPDPEYIYITNWSWTDEN